MSLKPKRSRKNSMATAHRINDTGTPERAAKGDVDVVNGVSQVRRLDALEFYKNRKIISLRQFGAGDRFFKDYEISHATPSYLGKEPGNDSTKTPQKCAENAVSAYESYHSAISAVGRVSGQILQHVCVEGKMMDSFVDVMGWNQRNTGIDRLREALDDLYDYYRSLYDSQIDGKHK